MVGTTVAGSYRIEGVIGTGSMGVVYQAEQLTLRRHVALKVIGDSADDDTTRARFRREARAASKLNHPNVVQVYDFGQLPGGQPYLAMELLEGKTLETLIDEEFPLDLSRIIRIQIDILRALQAAHEIGILHRDLKPANVFVSEAAGGGESAKVLDFGIATAMDSSLTGTQTWAPLTEAGFVCGTPAFMSPEQVQGFPLDQRSDLFSAAGLLYQMMTRERPFKGKSPVEVGANIVLKPLIPPSRARPDLELTDVMDDFLVKAMAKQPDDRYPTAEEMIAVLNAMLVAIEGVTDSGTSEAQAVGDEVPPTAEWPEGKSGEDEEYPDTVVNQRALSANTLAAKPRGDKIALSASGKQLLPTPFADLDPAALTPPPGSLQRGAFPKASLDNGPARASRPSLGRPTPRERPPLKRPPPVEDAEDTVEVKAVAATEDDIPAISPRGSSSWLSWAILVAIAAAMILWLIFLSPWAADGF